MKVLLIAFTLIVTVSYVDVRAQKQSEGADLSQIVTLLKQHDDALNQSNRPVGGNSCYPHVLELFS